MSMAEPPNAATRTEFVEAGKTLRNLWGSQWVDFTGGVAAPKTLQHDDCVVRLLLAARDRSRYYGMGHFDVVIDLCAGTMLRAVVQKPSNQHTDPVAEVGGHAPLTGNLLMQSMTRSELNALGEATEFGAGLSRLLDNDLSRHASWHYPSRRVNVTRRYTAWELKLAGGAHDVGLVRLHHAGDFGSDRFDMVVEVWSNGRLAAQCGALPRKERGQTSLAGPHWRSAAAAVSGSVLLRQLDYSRVERSLWRTEVPEVDCAGAFGDTVLVVQPWAGQAKQLTLTEV